MSRRNDEPDWSDERIRAAYRRMADGGPASDVILPVMDAVKRDRRDRLAALRSAFRRPAGALAGAAVVLAVVSLVGALVVYRGAPTTASGSPGPQASGSPTPGEALPVRTVSQTLALVGASGLVNTDLFAVQGWLSIPTHMSCATFTVDASFGVGCGGDVLSITEDENGGATIKAFVLEGTTVPDSVSKRPGRPVQIEVVGHVNDMRASRCSDAARPACAAAFVVDQVSAFDGKSFGPSVGIVTGESNPTPKLSEAQVSSVVGSALEPDSTIVSMTAAALIDAVQTFWPGLGPSGDGSMVIWYVRVAGPPPLSPLMPGAHSGSGVLVLYDAGGVVRGGAGWGWDPAKSGLTLADGSVTLHTTNWLPGGACAGVGLEAVLRGSKDDPRIVWLQNIMEMPSGMDIGPTWSTETIVWPAGYHARFTPKIEIVDGTGNVVLRDGDPVGGACGTGAGTLYLEPPFK